MNDAYTPDGYRKDGHEGLHTVVGFSEHTDYYLAKGDISHDPVFSAWDVILHEGRLTPVGRHMGKRVWNR